MKIRTELKDRKKKCRMNFRHLFNIISKFEYLKALECFYNSINYDELAMDIQEIDNTNKGTDYPCTTNSPLSQIIILNQSDLPSEEKKVNAITLLKQLKDSDDMSDKERIEAFIYIHLKMDLNEWLLTVVKEFIHLSIKKMKLYLIQRNLSYKRQRLDMQSYVFLTDPFQNQANEIEFQGWSGLENEQASFHKWLTKVRAKRSSLEPRDYEIEDSISNV